MKARHLICLMAILVTSLLAAQVPIEPIWIQLVPSSSAVTKLALDSGTDHLHLAFQPGPADGHTHIRAYNTDGNEAGTELRIGSFMPPTSTTWYPTHSDMPLRLLAQDDTLYLLDHYVDQFDYVSWYRSTRITLDSSTTFAMHTGSGPQVDIHHDPYGDITVSPTVIRNFSNAHWLLGRAVVPTTDRIAADEVRIYCGRVPNIVPVDRASMALLSPLVVPSSGTSTRTLLRLTGNVIHYASVNSNLTMDIGAVDTTGALIWNFTMGTTENVTLSGLALDALGNMWVAASRSGATPSGLLYRFNSMGLMTGEYIYGRTIDDIVISGDRIFLSGWDTTQSTLIYLTAFFTDITTSVPDESSSLVRIFPNPASNVIQVDGVPQATMRVTITDLAGRLVQELPGPFSVPISIPVAYLPSGAYLLLCATENLVRTSRFSVVH